MARWAIFWMVASLATCLCAQTVRTNGSERQISAYVRNDAPTAQIEVHAARPAPFRIPRTVYGTFLEDIGKSIYGGVSAQLLDNPSLEDYPASLAALQARFSDPAYQHSSYIGIPLPWLPLHAGQGRRYEPRWGSAANSERYLYLMGLAQTEVGIRQAIYLPVEREAVYKGVLFESSNEGPQTLEVSFRRHDQPEAVLASEVLQARGTPGWHKLNFQMTLPAGSVAPLEPVDFAVSIHGDRRLSIDEIRLYPADAVDGFDPDVVRAAAALRSPLLRYGGNFTSSYHWKNGIGPLDGRRTMLNEAWGIPEYNLFGTDELMKFCQLIGARPQICLNLGSGSPEEARGWVEYCQGGVDTPGGKMRAANGHPAPYSVAAWELGNELWNHDDVGWQTPESNAARYEQFYKVIAPLVPSSTMLFATGADIDFYRAWNGALIRHDGSDLQYLATHFVVGMNDVVNPALGRDQVWAADFAVPVGVGRALEPLKKQIDATPTTRGRVKLAYTEWLFASPANSPYPRWDNLGGALVAAGWMNMLLENADFVPVSDMTGLMEFGGIQKRHGRVFETPQYWAFWLYSNFAGDTPVQTQTVAGEYDVKGGVRRVPDIPGVPWLDVLATRDSRTHALSLFVVNRNWRQGISAQLRITGFAAAPEATVRTLSSDSILTRNDEVHPRRVHPITTQMHARASGFAYAFPAHSLTVINLEPK